MKDPAFLFYPGDWLGGTLGMTFEEKGAYMELLMMQFNRGHMTSHMVGQVVGQLWDKIKDKFIQDEAGLWYNVRLESEQNKRNAYTNSRKNNIKGTNQHTKNIAHMEGHMTSHMENENINENRNIIKEGGAGGGIVFYDLENVYSELINSHSWIESICRYVKNQTPETVNLKIREFVDMLKSKENTGKTLRQYKEYFSNWLKYDNEKSTGRKHEGDFRVSVGVQNFTETE